MSTHTVFAIGLLAATGCATSAASDVVAPIDGDDADFEGGELNASAIVAAWPEDRRTPRRTGYDPYDTELGALSARSFSEVWSAPAAGRHLAFGSGALLVSSESVDAVLALDPQTGEPMWTAAGDFIGPAAVTGDAVAVRTPASAVAVLSASTGALTRTIDAALGPDPSVFAALTARGDIFFTSDFGFEECLPRDLGEECFPRRTIGRLWGVPRRGGQRFGIDMPFGAGVPALANGRIFLAGSDLSFYSAAVAAFGARDGRVLWQAEHVLDSGGAPRHPPAVIHGRVFAMVGWGQLAAYAERDGQRLWLHAGDRPLSGLIATDTSVYLTSGPASGTLRFEELESASGLPLSSLDLPAEADQGEFVATRTLLIGGVDGDLVLMDRSDLTVVARVALGGRVGSPVLRGGRVYVGNGERVFCLAPAG